MNRDYIQQQLWDYIDGHCDALLKARIEEWIATDPEWKEEYAQILAFHKLLPELTEAEEPSMRFTQNLMENIAGKSVARPAQAYINPFIVRSIAAFFIISMLVSVVYAFINNNWSVHVAGTAYAFDIALDANTMNVLTMVNVVAGLLFIDALFRRKKKLTGSSSGT